MGTRKKELFDKMESIKAHTAGLLVLLHGLEEQPNIHFEIGFTDAKGHTKCVYTSTSINRTLNEYSLQGYTEKAGYLVDAWEDGNPAADISTHTASKKKKEPKVMFEINKKVRTGTTGTMGAPVGIYEYETVFRSASIIDCRTEWYRKRYTKESYVVDVREAPKEEESYHVADIDISSMTKEVSRLYGKQWLMDLLKHHNGSGVEVLADRILEAYGRGKA